MAVLNIRLKDLQVPFVHLGVFNVLSIRQTVSSGINQPGTRMLYVHTINCSSMPPNRRTQNSKMPHYLSPEKSKSIESSFAACHENRDRLFNCNAGAYAYVRNCEPFPAHSTIEYVFLPRLSVSGCLPNSCQVDPVMSDSVHAATEDLPPESMRSL